MATTTGSKRLLDISANAMAASNSMTYGGLNVATESWVSTQIANLVSSAPGTLDTLNELAAALGDDPNFATTITTALAGKLATTHDMTLTLAGDASGSATFTNMGNATLTVAVANDSHTHDGRYYTETEVNNLLAGKLSTTGKAADSNLLDGLDLHTGRNNEANKVVRTNASGYVDFGWINTTSGNTTSTITDIYVNTNDGYIRKATLAHVKSQLGLGSAAYVATSTFAAASHTHAISEVDGLQDALDAKQPAGSYLLTTGKAADSNLLDGINSTSFLRSDQADTMSGTLTITGSSGVSRLRIEGTTPTIDLDDSDGDSFYIHVNSNNFYILADRDGAGNYNDWEGPHPLQLEGDTNKTFLFGNEVKSAAYQATSAFDAAGAAAAVNDRIDNDVIPLIPTNNNQLTNGAGYITDGNTGWNNSYGFITASSNITGTSAGVVKTVSGTSSAELVRGNMGDNDQARILVGASASNAGYLEIATADDGTEPIYVRQYTGVFSTLQRTATLLDGSGNTSFPGNLTSSNLVTNQVNIQSITSDGTIANDKGSYLHLGGWAVGRTDATAVLVNTAYRSDILSYTRSFTIGNTARNFNGSANVSWTLADIGAEAAGAAAAVNDRIDNEVLPAIGDITLGSLGFTGATNANYITNNNQLSNGAGYLTSTNDRVYITDSRGAARAPSYYNDRYAQWDFQNQADTGAGGDGWHSLLTVSKWSSFHESHRQEQLIFTGENLKRRTAISDADWGEIKTIWDSGNLDPVINASVSNDTITFTRAGGGTFSVTTSDANTNTWRPIDQTPTNGATGDSISSDWAYDNVRNFSNGGNTLNGTLTATAFVGDGSGLTNLPSSGGGGGALYWESPSTSPFAEGTNDIVETVDDITDEIGLSMVGIRMHNPDDPYAYTAEYGMLYTGLESSNRYSNFTVQRGWNNDFEVKTRYSDPNAMGSAYGLLTYNGVTVEDSTGYFRQIHISPSGMQHMSDQNGYAQFAYNGPRGDLSISGNLNVGGEVNAQNVSDAKLKENVVPISNAVDKVKAIGGVEFDWKDIAKDYTSKTGNDVGVIAQDVQSVYPLAVAEVDKEAGDKILSHLAVDYIKLVPLALQAIKELSETVDVLRAEIEQLKTNS